MSLHIGSPCPKHPDRYVLAIAHPDRITVYPGCGECMWNGRLQCDGCDLCKPESKEAP